MRCYVNVAVTKPERRSGVMGDKPVSRPSRGATRDAGRIGEPLFSSKTLATTLFLLPPDTKNTISAALLSNGRVSVNRYEGKFSAYTEVTLRSPSFSAAGPGGGESAARRFGSGIPVLPVTHRGRAVSNRRKARP